MDQSIRQKHIEARDRQYALADAAAERGDGVAQAVHIRNGRLEDKAAQDISVFIAKHYPRYYQTQFI